MTWPAWADAPQYEVRYWTKADWNAGNRGATKTVVVTPGNAVTLTGLEAGTEYVIRAFVKYQHRTWRASAPFYASTADAAPVPQEPDPVPQQAEQVIVVEEPPVLVEEEPVPEGLIQAEGVQLEDLINTPVEDLFADAEQHPDAVPQMNAPQLRPPGVLRNISKDRITLIPRGSTNADAPEVENPAFYEKNGVWDEADFQITYSNRKGHKPIVTWGAMGDEGDFPGGAVLSARTNLTSGDDWTTYGYWMYAPKENFTKNGTFKPQPDKSTTLEPHGAYLFAAGGSRAATGIGFGGTATYRGTADGVVTMSQQTYDDIAHLQRDRYRNEHTPQTDTKWLATFEGKPFSLTADFGNNTVTGGVKIGFLDGRWIGTDETAGNRPFWNSMGTRNVIFNGSLDPAKGELSGYVGFDGSQKRPRHTPNGGGSWEATFYGAPDATAAPGLVSGVFKAESKDNGMFFESLDQRFGGTNEYKSSARFDTSGFSPGDPNGGVKRARNNPDDFHARTDYARSSWKIQGAFGGAKE